MYALLLSLLACNGGVVVDDTVSTDTAGDTQAEDTALPPGAEGEHADGAPAVYINELLAKGTSTGWAEGDDWLELYNAGATQVDLGGYSLWSEDDGDADEQVPWTFPAGTALAAGAWLAVVCDQGTEDDGQLHASFHINRAGGTIYLYPEGEEWETAYVDAVTFWEQEAGSSMARVPDGGASWASATEPTPGATNGQ